MTPEQRRALIDHELSHCSFLDQVPEMRHHDIEEFKHIIERYGFWTACPVGAHVPRYRSGERNDPPGKPVAFAFPTGAAV